METDNECPCGKVFKHHYLLLRHQEGNRGCEYTKPLKPKVDIEPKEYKCNKCEKRLSTKFNLERHFNTCTNNSNVKNIVEDTSSLVNNSLHSANHKYIILQQFQNIIEIMNTLNDGNNDMIKTIFTDMTNLRDYIKKLNINVEKTNTTPIITMPTSNVDIEQLVSINELDTINDNSNSHNTDNSHSHNTTNNNTNCHNTNITNNNAPNIFPIIYPFGYENLSFLSHNDMLKILTSPTCLNDALEKIFTRQEHKSYFKQNANRQQVEVINNQFTTTVFSDRQFKDEMIKNLIIAIQRMFYICKNNLEFLEQVVLWQNIKLLKTNYTNCLKIKNEKDLPSNVKTIMDNIYNLVFENKANEQICDNFALFKNKITKDAKYKDALLNLLQSIIKELEDYKQDLENITIDEEILQSYWEQPEASIDLNHKDNNVLQNDYIETPRYKYFEDMIEVENDKLNENTQSVGNINEVHKIRDERKEEEIKRIVDYFNLSKIRSMRMRTDLIVQPKNGLFSALQLIRKKYKL